MKRVIVTGATGFVGANLVRRLVRDGHQVHLFVRQGFAPWRIAEIRAEVRLHQVDLCDAEALFSVVRDIRPDWIFHLATHGAYSSQTDLRQIIGTNILGTIHLVEACLKVGFEAFVNTGSSSEYGFKDHAPSERDWLEPNSYYAVGKASATLFCRFTAQSRGVHLPTLRLYSVYGPYEEPTRLMPALIVRGLRGELPPLVNPKIARDYVYVDDVCEAYLLAATQTEQEPGAVYNIGSGVQTSLAEVVAAARRLMAISAEPQWGTMPDRQWDTTVWVADNRQALSRLNWTPKYSFESGLSRMLDWFRDNPTLTDFYEQHQP
ncbi:MAG TPA: NAD-dependent epimerase/dehydratase family protein [Blastocatellia bacterium]|nr:NAD-dependent epimerase/dehydratase family protein [Blastocatellia bacterium]HMV84659.1 NAD-dependent epimerase/dehydratase family protein [Blastocatellia bacterium]HMX25752.1 NAD-dependent epimerase/dehydratase family protein [Blastocatellia bacterium]HMY71053.1 NAD-dependent epimerase/dehydratase family protein [Blastocatellia bacterium]HMZ18670.1 NAD-dependent epimerase/dehydratase family protein [Blastocatellia bacterium]